jgi:hypothetical protein
MSGFKGQGTCNAVLDYLMQGTFVATLDACLMTAAPTATGGGTEVSAGDYARVAVTANSTNFPNASAASMANGTEIVFSSGTTNAWGTVVGVAFVKSTAGGTLGASDIVYYAPLTASRNILVGDPVNIPIGAAIFTEA